jgi:hypothetical protein
MNFQKNQQEKAGPVLRAPLVYISSEFRSWHGDSMQIEYFPPLRVNAPVVGGREVCKDMGAEYLLYFLRSS